MQGQRAGSSTAQGSTSTSYSKKVEIFTDSGEYDGSRMKFEEWWVKAQAWLKVNKHAILAGSQDAVGVILSWFKGLKTGHFTQVCFTQATQGIYEWDHLVCDVEELFQKKALYLQAEVNDSHAVELLERNTMPGMIARIFQEGKWMENLIDYLK